MTARVSKTSSGRFFDDFKPGEVIAHAIPRTLSHGEAALYGALTGSRFAPHASGAFARGLSLPDAPLDDLLVFHTVFGKTVPDISLNAIANLGYADCRFLRPVYPGATLSAESEVIGLKETSRGDAGVVYVRTTGRDQDGAAVLSYVRWVLVRKREGAPATGVSLVPKLPEAVAPSDLPGHPARFDGWDGARAGAPYLFEDYEIGERIDHVDGMTVQESEHMLATRLYQNTARVHFNQFTEAQGRFGRRLVYGGVVMSTARALSFNGLGSGVFLLAINGGRHVNPFFAGGTIFAWSEVLGTTPLHGRTDAGAVRLRTVATVDRPCADFPDRSPDGTYRRDVVLDLDYWVVMARRRA